MRGEGVKRGMAEKLPLLSGSWPARIAAVETFTSSSSGGISRRGCGDRGAAFLVTGGHCKVLVAGWSRGAGNREPFCSDCHCYCWNAFYSRSPGRSKSCVPVLFGVAAHNCHRVLRCGSRFIASCIPSRSHCIFTNATKSVEDWKCLSAYAKPWCKPTLEPSDLGIC
jgi:hypothetical protein